MSAPRDCPCHSQKRYAACCGPLHRGEVPAPSPEALMRSRYSAFALGLGDYLVTTLAKGHEDRAHPEDVLARELSRVKEKRRFLGLSIVDAREAGDEGEVLFFARIFEKGKDASFAELSRFVREDGAWRYESGVLVPGTALPDAASLTRARFLEVASSIDPA